MRTAKRQIKNRTDIKRLGTILGVWAHPDDETWTSAGIMRAAILNGQRVACVTATRGEAGVQDESKWPTARLGDIRERELYDALEHLGVKEHYWLNYHDGMCDQIDVKEAVMKVRKIIEQVRPDTILTFGPEGMTGHPDHCCISRWTTQALAAIDRKAVLYHAVNLKEWYEKVGKALDREFNVFYNIERPLLKKAAEMDILYHLPEDILDDKIEAFRAQPSQMQGMFDALGAATMRLNAETECFVKAN